MSISFPNAGGIIVSNHTLAAILLIPKISDLGKRLGDYIYFLSN